MSNTGFDHPLVRQYLRDLDAAVAALPADRAAELSEQIAAHLDEALTPGADDSEVAATLKRLGRPADLAAEAGAPATAGTIAKPAATFGSLARARLARVRKRIWVATALTVIVIGAGAGYLASYLSHPSVSDLQYGPGGGWWYSKDYNREVDTTADGANQSTVPIRDGQQQGLAVSVYNPTSWTQTIIGAGPGQGAPGSATVKIGVSVFNHNINVGGFTRQVRFTLPGSIPPHQIRLLRLLWISDVCLRGRGTEEGIDNVDLRVRVAGFIKTEKISLGQGWYVAGPSHGRCG